MGWASSTGRRIPAADPTGTVTTVDDGGQRTSRIVRWWRSLPTLFVDAVLASTLLAVSLAEVALNDDDRGGQPMRTILLVAMSATVVFRRRWPVAVWVLSGVLVSIYGIGSFPDPTLPYAPLLAVYTVVALTSWRTAAWTGAVTAASICVALLIDPDDDVLDWVVALLSFVTAWLVGNNVRVHRAYANEMEARAVRLERERQAQEQRAIAEERLRLARELHDVAAHHVSVIALHAEAGQAQLPDDPERAGQSLAVIGEVARTTLDELRRVVGVLREREVAAPRAPQPGLDYLPRLLHDVEQAGLPVALHVIGTPRPVSDAIGASAYRIVQEALTNVMRHAGAAHAAVEVRYESDAVAVQVTDDGHGPVDGTPTGHGLAGMRERAAMFGGTFTATRGPHGGFAVSARLPL